MNLEILQMDRIVQSLVPKTDLFCFICHEIVVDPRVCESCEEVCCLKCCQILKTTGSKCKNPECSNAEVFAFKLPMKKWLNLLIQAEIKCRNSTFGCQDVLNYGKLRSHEEEECVYREVVCPNEHCSEKMRIFKKDSHLCQFRLVSCQNTGCQEKFCFNAQEDHLLNCLFLPKCAHECLTCKIQRKKLEIKSEQLALSFQNIEKKIDIDEEKQQKANLELEAKTLGQKLVELERLLEVKNKAFIKEKGDLLMLLDTKDKEIAILNKKCLLLNEAPKKESQLEVKNFNIFDAAFSKNYYVFSENFTKATWNQSSPQIGYADYQHYPVARIAFLFTNGFRVKFIMQGYGWFGLGSVNVVAEGFPGYTPEGWVIRNSNGGMYHNQKEILVSQISCDSKNTILNYDPKEKVLEAVCDNQKASYKNIDFPNEVYFVVSVRALTSVKILEVTNSYQK